MPAAAQAKTRRQLPQHELADRHTLLIAALEFSNKRRLRLVEDMTPCGVVGLQRIREYALDLRARWLIEHDLTEDDSDRGWKAFVSRELALPYATCYAIIKGKNVRVSLTTIERIMKKLGIPARYFLDPEV